MLLGKKAIDLLVSRVLKTNLLNFKNTVNFFPIFFPKDSVNGLPSYEDIAGEGNIQHDGAANKSTSKYILN